MSHFEAYIAFKNTGCVSRKCSKLQNIFSAYHNLGRLLHLKFEVYTLLNHLKSKFEAYPLIEEL